MDERVRVSNDAVQLLMEEYRTLRAEILVSITAQQSTLTFGSASLALLVSAGAAVREDTPRASVAVFVLVIPLVCAFAVNSWLAELGRMFRAGSWLRRVERRVNEHVALPGHRCPVLWWENWAHSKDQGTTDGVANEDIDRRYLLAVTGTLLTIGVLSVLFGGLELVRVVELDQHGARSWHVLWLALPAGALAYLVWVARRSRLLYARADAFRTGSATTGRSPAPCDGDAHPGADHRGTPPCQAAPGKDAPGQPDGAGRRA